MGFAKVPMPSSGWRLPWKFKVIGTRGWGAAFARVTRSADTYDDARDVRGELFLAGFEMVWIESNDSRAQIAR